MFNFAFVTGIARSGTNLIGRMLAQHRDFAVAMDPFLPILKWFRSGVSAAGIRSNSLPLRVPIQPAAPLDDYYFFEERQHLMEAIRTADLNLSFEEERWPSLQKDLEGRAIHECADLVPYLAQLKAPTYASIWQAGLDLVAQKRGKGSPRWVGVKELWSVEFISHFLTTFPSSKAVIIVRDPRAVVASMLKMGEDDSSQQAQILSYVRHWRKLAAFASCLYKTPAAEERLVLIRYEDLVRDPEGKSHELCRFFGVEFDPAMLDAAAFWDPSRQSSWRGNSSYTASVSEINASFASRWESYLTQSQIRLIDFLCGADMLLFGYHPRTCCLPISETEIPVSAFVESYGAPASWRSDSGDPLLDLGLEVVRRSLLTSSNRPAPKLITRCFLFEEVYDQLLNGLSVCGSGREAG